VLFEAASCDDSNERTACSVGIRGACNNNALSCRMRHSTHRSPAVGNTARSTQARMLLFLSRRMPMLHFACIPLGARFPSFGKVLSRPSMYLGAFVRGCVNSRAFGNASEAEHVQHGSPSSSPFDSPSPSESALHSVSVHSCPAAENALPAHAKFGIRSRNDAHDLNARLTTRVPKSFLVPPPPPLTCPTPGASGTLAPLGIFG
jgi:hypothetical protein